MEEKKKAWSGLAIASLACGVLSMGLGFFMLGILAGIPAIVCGHLGRARIRKSGAGMRGKGMALAGMTMGYLGSAARIVMLALGGLALMNQRVAVSHARVDVANLAQAIEQYYQEYSKIPESGAGDFTTSDPAGKRLLAHLMGDGHNGESVRAICLLQVSSEFSNIPLQDRMEHGWFDAWGKPFRVILDDDYDNVLQFTYGGRLEVVPNRLALVASRGADGIEGTEDDVKSW